MLVWVTFALFSRSLGYLSIEVSSSLNFFFYRHASAVATAYDDVVIHIQLTYHKKNEIIEEGYS